MMLLTVTVGKKSWKRVYSVVLGCKSVENV